MMTGIPEGIVALILTAIGVVAWFGIRRIVAGQDSMNATLSVISDRLATINGRVGKMETWTEMHEHSDDERMRRLEKEDATLWQEIRTISSHKRGTA